MVWTCVVVLGGMFAIRPVASAVAQNAARTVWEGIYTEEQAQRGQETYRKTCGGCHADDLTGDDAPALRGGHFASRWDQQTIWDLMFTIGTTMPLDTPSSLDPQEYADIIAFILRENGMPAGKTELLADPEEMTSVVITARPPGN